MKPSYLLRLLAIGACAVASLFAQDAAAPTPHPAVAELRQIVMQVQAKMKTDGENTAEKFADELAQFDALLKKYENDKSDEVAQLALMKASLYIQVLDDEETGKKELARVVELFPGTGPASGAARTLKSLTPEAKAAAAAKRAEEKAKLDALVGNPAPELNFTWSSEGDYKTLADLKGKVVVLDFWATWCGPCIASFPAVREHVAHFEDAPVVFLGVTSLQGKVYGLGSAPVDTKGDPQKEYELTREFMKAKEMTWPVVFSEQNVFNPDYVVRGIPYVAILAPDGTVRHVGLHPANAAGDISGKITKILEEFNLATPKA